MIATANSRMRTVIVANPHGLHVRACASIVETVDAFNAHATVYRGMLRAEANSILELLMLTAQQGTENAKRVNRLATTTDYRYASRDGGRRLNRSHLTPSLAWSWNRCRESSYEVSWHRPTAIDLSQEPEGVDPDQCALLSVAHGLSVHRQRWPEVFELAEVEQLKNAAEVIPSLGHWW